MFVIFRVRVFVCKTFYFDQEKTISFFLFFGQILFIYLSFVVAICVAQMLNYRGMSNSKLKWQLMSDEYENDKSKITGIPLDDDYNDAESDVREPISGGRENDMRGMTRGQMMNDMMNRPRGRPKIKDAHRHNAQNQKPQQNDYRFVDVNDNRGQQYDEEREFGGNGGNGNGGGWNGFRRPESNRHRRPISGFDAFWRSIGLGFPLNLFGLGFGAPRGGFIF